MHNRALTQIAAGLTLGTAVVLSAGLPAHAAGTPEEQCQKARYKAAAKYADCEHEAVGKWLAGGITPTVFQNVIVKCRLKYTRTWTKLRAQESLTESTCDQPRFEILGDGTVRDHLTGLQWEQKTDDASMHDKDDVYALSSSFALGEYGDGDAFTSFLATLNSGSCFAGHCDWRLPTRAELQTILLDEPYPCEHNPCIEEDTFGPTADFYWSATRYATEPTNAWGLWFLDGFVGLNQTNFSYSVRAMRGGL